MKQKSNIKTGDKVPVERNVYFVVEKPFVRSKTTDEDEDYSFYQVGDAIVITARRLEQCSSSFKDFLKNNCRAATDNEISTIYNDLYSNARVGNVYDDGSYQIRRFFIAESFDELFEKFDFKNERNKNSGLEIVDLLDWEYNIITVCIGYYKGKLFLFTEFYEEDTENLLEVCRRATSEEAVELSFYVKRIQDRYRRKHNFLRWYNSLYSL